MKPYSFLHLFFQFSAAAILCGCSLLHPVAKVTDDKSQSPASESSPDTISAAIPAPSASRQALTDSLSTVPRDSLSAIPAAMKLSSASELMINACDNYISVNPRSQKTPEVLAIKGSVYYNNNLFAQSRMVYSAIIDSFPESPFTFDAIRMVAQSYFQEKRFDEAQQWYRKMHEIAGGGIDKEEAMARIAQSIFKMAEMHENQQRYDDAAIQYERVAMEFPEAAIADAALFNAGNSYEKLTEWTRAILVYQRLSQKYEASTLLAKAKFRAAKCYEKLLQWESAASSYLHLVKEHPASELTEASLYNAGLCFENAEKPIEAAATFEKLSVSFPDSRDAPDVLFRAGEIYGKQKDWPNVTRVNQEFSRRYGGDINRVVQAQCMLGVALFMQNRHGEAIEQLESAVGTYRKLAQPSDVNRYYAAKAQYTIGEIYHEQQKAVLLTMPKIQYRKLLNAKTGLLDKSVDAYSKVIQFQMSEWTTRSIYQLGQAYEDFAVGVFKQERPAGLSLEEQMGLELGIANAVEEYFVSNALHYHEQNVKLGIKEKLDDKYVLSSKQKLTYLPYVAGFNFLALVDIADKAASNQQAEGFALIAQKLQMLQKIAPFQERAITLFTKTLEMGTMYQEKNEFYDKSSSLITRTSFTVAETYASVATIAREAPIPADFDKYEQFVYRKKLLDQIRDYEDNALTSYLKTMNIAEAYAISDDFVARTREQLPRLLFTAGRCFDLLCMTAINMPPYPDGVSDAEKEEYQARFQEIGLNFQELAFEFYRAVIKYAKQGYASGEFVNHAYVRLYQNNPEEFGKKKELIADKSISSGPEWKCATEYAGGWDSLEFNDAQWVKPRKLPIPAATAVTGFPGEPPIPMWLYKGELADTAGFFSPPRVYFRRSFYISETPQEAVLYLTAVSRFSVFLNGKELTNPSDTSTVWNTAKIWDLAGRLRQGKNVLAVSVSNDTGIKAYGLMPFLSIRALEYDYVPVFPQTEEPVDKQLVADGRWEFPLIKNFSPVSATVQN